MAKLKGMSITADEGSFSSGEDGQEKQVQDLKTNFHGGTTLPPQPPKRKRNLPGTPGLFVCLITLIVDFFKSLSSMRVEPNTSKQRLGKTVNMRVIIFNPSKTFPWPLIIFEGS